MVPGPNNKPHSFNFKSDNKDSNLNANNKFIAINKIMKNNLKYINQLYKTCIESKYTWIVKSKNMTSIIKSLQKIHADL